METYGKEINIGLYWVSPLTINFQMNIFCILEKFQDVCVIMWKFLTRYFQLWKTYAIFAKVNVNLLYQIKQKLTFLFLFLSFS